MCDQSEVTYLPGEVVWVKLGPVWWPGQVQDYDTLDEEITSNFKKKPIAVVKFFQEDSFEYVKNLNHIYRYNSQKKEEFIKKGLDMVRSTNSRDVPSNMKMFPNDVVTAEHLTGGNPNILDEKTFAPEQKSNYSNLFGSKKMSGKKFKSDYKKEDIPNLKKKVAITPMKNRRSLPTLPSSVPRPITHPRFIVKALEGRSDHEVRIRCQFSSSKNDEEISPKKYTCHVCGFQASRLNVIILHNKSHSAGYAEAYKIKPQNKTKEREPVLSEQNSFSEKTPSVTTSRGRVKVLPKKLLDYTDEPLPKMLKEKTPNKSSSEKTPEVSKRSPEKITKKEKNSSEKLAAKRPLFGKRKSVKEKAELAAKQKQDNEVMKETLLKDWDDDDVNQEEVELERLKQALESPSSDISDDNCTSLDNSKMELDDNEQFSEKLEVTTDAKTTEAKKQSKTDDKAEVFEFDDSEDSFPVAINFRPKNQREQKFTDDKFKKPKPPKPLSKITTKNKSSVTNLPSASPSQDGDMEKKTEGIEKKNEDLETAEFNDAFNALLQETAVPDIPEIPKTLNSLLSDQTSDISSTTDLMAETGGNKTVDENPNLEAMEISQSCDADNSFKVECSSSGRDLKSDFEHVKPTEKSSTEYDSNEINCSETQKNANDVSAFDPRVEMNTQILSSGVPPTTAENETMFQTGSADDKLLDTYVTAVEITSSCDASKSTDHAESCGQTNESFDKSDVGLSGEKTSTDLPDESIKSLQGDSTESGNKQNLVDDSQIGCSLRESDLVNKGADDRHRNLRDDSLSHHVHTGADKESCNVILPKSERTKLYNTKEETNSFNESNFGPAESLIKMEEDIVSQFDNSINKEEHKTRMEQDESQLLETVSSAASHSNVHLLLPVSTEYNSVHVLSQQQPLTQNIHTFVPKHELPQTCSTANQNIGQNLQDMELDINSMPVIIGGEDFIQPDETKNVLPIQLKYPESIVVNPKTVPSPSKSEGLIMKIEVPTSSQHLQPLINIPSKSTRGGVKGGRTQKTTSKTIKLSASTLKNLGNLHKGGNQQVLILKTASGQDKPEGSSDKSKAALNMVQHGNKILIVNNTQMSGQTAIKLNPQQLISGGKLSPGTRVFTSKVSSATSSTEASSNISKTTLSRSPSKPQKKIVFSQSGGILATTSKNVIINSSSGKLITVPSTQTVTTSKGKSLITHNILGSKSSLILPSPSQNALSNSKPSTVLTSQTLAPSQSTMILAPITSKGGTVLAGNQKLRIVSSKAPISGTRFVVQNSQGKFSLDPLNKNQQLKLVSGLKGAQQGSTFLIKTSQGIFTKPLTTSSITMAAKQPSIRASSTSKTILTTVPTQAKISGAITKTVQSRMVQHPKVLQQPQVMQSQIITTPKIIQQSQILHHQTGQTEVGKQDQLVKKSQTVKRLGVQKSRQSPNIIQKTQRKATPRTPKPRGNRFISPAIKEPVVMATCSNLPVVSQAMVQGQISQNPDVLYLTVDESGNYRPLDNKSLVTIERPSETPSSLYIPANNQPQDVGNIFIAIDESGNIINITQPTHNVSVSTGQDILAKALENTQVLQQETIIPDIDVTEALASSSMESSTLCSSFSDHSQYTPTLSHNVLETSLTLNQAPIMTPLEVPSVVPPNLGSMSALPTNFIASDLLSSKPKPLSPSMPLLTEEALSNQNRSGQVFLLDSSNSMIPTASGSQISIQLALNDSNVIVSSGSGCASSIAPSFRVVSGDMIPSELDMSNEANNIPNIVQEECIVDQDNMKVESDENVTLNIHGEQYRESLETTQIPVNQNSMIIQEAFDAPQENVKYDNLTTDISSFQYDDEEKLDISKEDKLHHVVFKDGHNVSSETIHTFSEELSDQGQLREENGNSLKRGLDEERTVSSSSDLEDDPKRMKIDER